MQNKNKWLQQEKKIHMIQMLQWDSLCMADKLNLWEKNTHTHTSDVYPGNISSHERRIIAIIIGINAIYTEREREKPNIIIIIGITQMLAGYIDRAQHRMPMCISRYVVAAYTWLETSKLNAFINMVLWPFY